MNVVCDDAAGRHPFIHLDDRERENFPCCRLDRMVHRMRINVIAKMSAEP